MSKRRRRITLADVTDDAPAKRQKYGSREIRVFGCKFQSKHEAEVYMERRQWLRAGLIRELELQPRFPLIIGGVAVKYENGRQMVYVADFSYIRASDGRRVVEDAKSDATRRKEAYRIKKQLMHAMGIDIIEV